MTYTLNLAHKDGASKAVCFKRALGIGQEDMDFLQDQIMAKVGHYPAARKSGGNIAYGERFSVVMPILGKNGKLVDVNTAWMYKRKTEGAAEQSVYPILINALPTKKDTAHDQD